MPSSPGDHRPAIRLTVPEQLAYMRIIEAETHRAGRRLLDTWAHPEDTQPLNLRLLDETLKLMWRTT